MKLALIVLGSILALIGIATFMFPDISYDTHKSIIAIGPINASLNATEILHIPTFFSAATLGLGLLILIFTFSKKSK